MYKKVEGFLKLSDFLLIFLKLCTFDLFSRTILSDIFKQSLAIHQMVIIKGYIMSQESTFVFAEKILRLN